jgi:hypothetical protein
VSEWCRPTGFFAVFTRDSGRIALLAGELRRVAVPTNSGRPHRIFRCATCQTAMWSEYGETLRSVRVGTLNDPAVIPPNVHIYVRSKLPWGILPEGVPTFEAYYDSQKLWPAVSLKRRRAILD